MWLVPEGRESDRTEATLPVNFLMGHSGLIIKNIIQYQRETEKLK